jgi:hypothetical protein
MMVSWGQLGDVALTPPSRPIADCEGSGPPIRSLEAGPRALSSLPQVGQCRLLVDRVMRCLQRRHRWQH